jgi:hypothetical protein
VGFEPEFCKLLLDELDDVDPHPASAKTAAKRTVVIKYFDLFNIADIYRPKQMGAGWAITLTEARRTHI